MRAFRQAEPAANMAQTSSLGFLFFSIEPAADWVSPALLLVFSWPLTYFHSRAERRASGHSVPTKSNSNTGVYVGQQMALSVTCKLSTDQECMRVCVWVSECVYVCVCVCVCYRSTTSTTNCRVDVHFMGCRCSGGKVHLLPMLLHASCLFSHSYGLYNYLFLTCITCCSR